jgi:hypothetical protein
MSIVTAIWLCRRIAMATRGWTFMATKRLAQVRRVECTGMTGTPARRTLDLNARWKLRGSIGSPSHVVSTRPVPVWALDIQFDETTDRRRLKSHVVDEHTREALAMRVGRTCI